MKIFTGNKQRVRRLLDRLVMWFTYEFRFLFGDTRLGNWLLIKAGWRLCSGYRVYPNGLKCCGCSDCNT